MKVIQKAFLFSLVYSLQIISNQTEQVAACPVSNSWYSKMLLCWEGLGTNIQLAIQLCLLLIVFYALSCLFQCKKKAGCETTCNCGCVDSCTCKPENSDTIEKKSALEDRVKPESSKTEKKDHSERMDASKAIDDFIEESSSKKDDQNHNDSDKK